jgi:hypothetical protein
MARVRTTFQNVRRPAKRGVGAALVFGSLLLIAFDLGYLGNCSPGPGTCPAGAYRLGGVALLACLVPLLIGAVMTFRSGAARAGPTHPDRIVEEPTRIVPAPPLNIAFAPAVTVSAPTATMYVVRPTDSS